MTTDEIKVLDKTVELHNAFRQLPELHPADIIDWTFHIHALQAILMSRDAVRNHPEIFKK